MSGTGPYYGPQLYVTNIYIYRPTPEKKLKSINRVYIFSFTDTDRNIRTKEEAVPQVATLHVIAVFIQFVAKMWIVNKIDITAYVFW